MGGTLGNPISDAEQERINETIQEVVKLFSIEFSKAYTQAVIAHVKAEVDPTPELEDALKLETAPVPSHVLKTGSLVKRGDAHKSWKQRFFVAYNAADNFKIDYLDGVDEKGRLKGTIFPAGYRAYEFNSDDIAEFGEAGIKLVPWSSRRRTWYIRCPDDQERKEWMTVFDNACYKAQPPRDPDECIAEAFDVTLRNLRWHYWFWGWYRDAGSEPERLGEFILDLLDRNVLNAVYDNIENNPSKSMTIDLIRKTVGSSVNAACSSAWISSCSAVRSMSDTIKSSAKDLLSPILETQKKFKEKITTMVGGTINPFLEEKGGNLIKPILKAIFKPVLDAFVQAIHGYHSHMSSKIASNEFAASRFESSLNSSDWQMDWWSGPLHKSYSTCYRIWDSDLAELASYFSGGLTPYNVYCMVKDKIEVIAHRAVYTFGKNGKDAADLNVVLSEVTRLMVHDAMLMCRVLLREVFKAILDSPITENVTSPCQAMVQPLQDEIDNLPVPGLSTLIDLPTMLEEVVVEIETGAIDAIISPSIGEISTTMAVAGTEIGLADLAF